MHRSLPLVALAAFTLSACQGGHQGAAPKGASPKVGVATCADAALTLPEDYVVATIGGENVTLKDLGPELAEVEANALREYCQQVHDARTMALENKVRSTLIERGAARAQMSVDEYTQSLIQTKVEEPSEEEIQAFYRDRAPPDAPPLDAVRPQIAAAIKQDKFARVVEQIFTDLEKEAKVERRLPDVRPPAVEVAVAAHTATAGADKPVVEVIEFADFECPYCQVMADALRDVKGRFKDKPVRFSYRHFPLSFHPNARPAAEISQCAREQGKFWEMHDKIFANMNRMDPASLRAYAEEVGLDAGALEACLASERPSQEVEADLAAGRAAGVRGTPTLYINGRPFQGRPSPDDIADAIQSELENRG